MVWPLGYLGLMARAQGDYAQAATLCGEEFAVLRELGDMWGYHWTLFQVGSIAQRQGDNTGASAHFAECLVWFRRNEEKLGVAACLEGMAGVASAAGQPARVVRLLAAAAAFRDTLGAKPFMDETVEYERQLAAARDLLGEERYAATWTEGQALTTGQAIAEALHTPDIERSG
jgi:hypothetical protein